MPSEFAAKVTSFPISSGPTDLVGTFRIVGVPVPGRWTLTRCTRHWKWAYQVVPGFGALYTSVTQPPAEIEFRGVFASPIDWAAFKVLEAKFLSRPMVGIIPAPLLPGFSIGIDHPELARMNISAVVLAEKSALVDQGGGYWETSLKFLEWTGAFKPLGSPAKAKIPSPTTPPVVPVNAQEVEMARLRAVLAADFAKVK